MKIINIIYLSTYINGVEKLFYSDPTTYKTEQSTARTDQLKGMTRISKRKLLGFLKVYSANTIEYTYPVISYYIIPVSRAPVIPRLIVRFCALLIFCRATLYV